MPVLVFKLKNVPEDEASDVRKILDNNKIDYYETTAGNWGISMPAVWVKEKTQAERARMLIEIYEQKRFTEEKEKYQQRKYRGEQKTMLDAFKQKPLHVVIYFSVAALILYLSFRLVLDLAQ